MENYSEIKEQLTRIERALIGDNLGNKGLVKRVEENEAKNDLMAKAILALDTKRKMSNLKLAGIIGTSVAGSTGAWEFIKYLASK
jgi:hypothetical protein